MSDEVNPEPFENLDTESHRKTDIAQLHPGRGKSGQQIGKENVEKLRNYVQDLKQKGEYLPMRNGKPNLSVIAFANGFDRGVFRDNPAARKVIEEAAKDKALNGEGYDGAAGLSRDKDDSGQAEPARQEETGRSAHIQKKLDRSDRHNKTLEEKLAMKTAECEALKQHNKELQEKLQSYEIFEEVMTANGRRFIP